jgi:Zn-dependent alcohol dehydrogenase
MVESKTPQTIRCKAAVAFAAKEPMKVVEIDVAAPRAGEVRVKVLANALCHTDIYTLSGADPEGKFPSILGHEATAVVESVGEGVTEYVVGDLVIPCYTPECKEWDCIFCQSEQTNLCPRIRATQGKSIMPDGTTRFTLASDGSEIFHFMGCSTFSEYTVLASISLAKINPQADPYQVCLVGCGVSTGWGAVMNNPNWRPGCSVAVWGLGAVGLAVTQAAALMGATRIYGMDVNPAKFELAKKDFGVTECFNPLEGNAKDWLISKEKWGIDFTYDCTGLVPVMRDALESAHRGFGESMVIGVAAAGKELATRPFQLITGRCWKGTAFGGWKSRQDVPKLVNKIMLGELPIDKFITHNFTGLEEV